MNRIEEIYYEAKADKWFKNFAVFCRLALVIKKRMLKSGFERY